VDVVVTTGTIQLLSVGINAINDGALITLASGGRMDMANNVNETVSRLRLDGVDMPPGTYGSSAGPATFQRDDHFSGQGILTILPPPPRPVGTMMIIR
ncbi:MAG: hypothetical protein AAF492_33100, partial [Verrucomicrobiota bacterium]